MERADAIHVLSRFTAEALYRAHPTAEKVRVIPHWVDDYWLSLVDDDGDSLWDPEFPTVFTVRRLVPRMGLEYAIRALGRLAADGKFRLVIAGDGPLRSELGVLADEVASNRPYRDRIRLVGRISDAQLRWAYRNSSTVVMPTVTLEGFGLPLLEAAAAGCQLVATRVGAIPEVVSQLPHSALVPPSDGKALQNAVMATLPSPPCAVRNEIRRAVADRYSFEVLFPKLSRIFAGHAPPSSDAT